jgi:hypothetical protein
LGKLENVYQEGVRNAEQEARFDIFWKRGTLLMNSILSKAKEKLEILAALRQATETYGDQKRKRKDAPAEIQQPSKTKKARTYVPPVALSVVNIHIGTKFEWAHKWHTTSLKRNNRTQNGSSVMSCVSRERHLNSATKYKILNLMRTAI